MIQDLSYSRKGGNTGSNHEACAEPVRTREPEPPADNEPAGATAPSRD